MENFRIVVKGFIVDEGKFLLVQRSKNEKINSLIYTLPGGNIHFGEKPKDAVKREVKEETNLDIEIEKINTVWSFMGEDAFIIGITFLCKPITRNIKLNVELEYFQWIELNTKKELPKSIMKEIEAYVKG